MKGVKIIRHNSETEYTCSRQGYYRDPNDCNSFYRCVKFNQYIDDYTVFLYMCPEGLVFDEKWEVCVWPSQTAPCGGSSEIFPIPRRKFVCPGEGYYADPENCRWFFACRDYIGDGTFTQYEFRCPYGLGFDEQKLICNWPWEVPNCGSRGAEYADGSQGGYLRQQEGYGAKDTAYQQPAPVTTTYRPTTAAPSYTTAYRPSPSPSPQYNQGQAPRVKPYIPEAGKYSPASGLVVDETPYEGQVVRELNPQTCINCDSKTLNVVGQGQVNYNGIEVGASLAGGYQGAKQRPAGYQSGSYEQPQENYGRTTQAQVYQTTARPYPPPSNEYQPPAGGYAGQSGEYDRGVQYESYQTARPSPSYAPQSTPKPTFASYVSTTARPYAPPAPVTPYTPAPQVYTYTGSPNEQR